MGWSAVVPPEDRLDFLKQTVGGMVIIDVRARGGDGT